MKTPVILSAFGTTSTATATYQILEHQVQEGLRQDDLLFWAYSSRIISKQLQQEKKSDIQHPRELLASLGDQGYSGAILQSLHLFPGTEFHRLHTIATEAPLPCAIGMPLLTSPEDYLKLAQLLEPTISPRPDRAILILGHGTEHPSWTAYYSLEKILRRHCGRRIFVGVVEKYPNSDHLPAQLIADGIDKVTIIPLFLIAGMHFRRDIASTDEDSWFSRLTRAGIDVETIDCGIGMLAGIEEIILEHIESARIYLRKKIENRP